MLLQKTVSDETELQVSKWDPNLEDMAVYVDTGISLIAFSVIARLNILTRR